MTAPARFDLLASDRARDWIDVFRALAIAQVVVFHVLFAVARFAPEATLPGFVDRLPWVMNLFWEPAGVDVIFVVSAFLLSYGLLSDTDTSLRSFAIKRLSRILPLYYVAIAFYGLLEGYSWQTILLSAVFLGYTVADSNVIPVGWSMEVMVLVYLALPFLMRWLTGVRRPIVWLTGVLILTVAVRFVAIAMDDSDLTLFFARIVATGDVPPIAFELYYRPWFRLTPFVIGIALAFVLAPQRRGLTVLRRNQALRLALVGGGLALFFALNWLPTQRPDSVWNLTRFTGFAEFYLGGGYALASMAVAMVLAGLIASPSIRRGLGQMRVFTILSRNIFAIYLFHFPCILIAAILVFATTDRTALEIAFGDAGVFRIAAISALALTISALIARPITRYLEIAPQNWLRRRFL